MPSHKERPSFWESDTQLVTKMTVEPPLASHECDRCCCPSTLTIGGCSIAPDGISIRGPFRLC